MLRKGTYKTRNGQTAKIYGPSRLNEGRWAGNVDGSFTVYEWRPDGKSVTSEGFDILEARP